MGEESGVSEVFSTMNLKIFFVGGGRGAGERGGVE